MSEYQAITQPGIDPAGYRTAGPLFAAFHGELVPHPWRDPESEHDAYQLFHQRSVAMGWLDERSSAAGDERAAKAPGLWAMNNAGCNAHQAAPEPFAWFQVECSTPAIDRPLPVQPFLRCAEDTVTRIGAAQLSAVQVLLPLQGLDPTSRPRNALVPSLETCDWFGERDPQAQTSVTISINSGRNPALPDVAKQLTSRLDHLEQEVFLHSGSESASEDITLPPPFADEFWNGPPVHSLTLRGDLAEWSCDAVGWLAATIADCAAHLGVRTPLLVSVVRG
ncbi:hypothetical protein AMK09_25735 [Streptomyces sp. CB02488]|uniref:hypothetical protein n=1 Tax=unclassified Streptomyces TaxID=2593676 RepID=UPI000966FD62|nr:MULTISPECIES: hypothetical protein [unclassified Streptomyces]OKK15529.1 hypothetical protein AMK09_25735 [Streptomyces sp. CB02488]